MTTKTVLILVLATVLQSWVVLGANLGRPTWKLENRSSINTTTAAALKATSINQGTVQLIQHLEGFRDNFSTVDGDQVIGFGHDCTLRKDCATMRPPLTMAQATELLQQDIQPSAACVCKLTNSARLNANQFGALTSFTFNSGCNSLAQSFGAVVQRGNASALCQTLAVANLRGGQSASRRQKEAVFCSQPSADQSPCNAAASSIRASPPAPASLNLELRTAAKPAAEWMAERDGARTAKKAKAKRTKLNKARGAGAAGAAAEEEAESKAAARDVAAAAEEEEETEEQETLSPPLPPVERYWRRCRWCRRGWGFGR